MRHRRATVGGWPELAEYACPMSHSASSSGVIFLPPGGGRSYQAGPMRAVFKADGAETDDRYCVSEWWLDAGDSGPGPHSHEDNVEIFYVLEGTMSFLVGEKWLDAPVVPSCAFRRELRTTSRTGAPAARARSTCSCLEASKY